MNNNMEIADKIKNQPIMVENMGDYVLTNQKTIFRRGVMWLGQTCNQRCKFCYFANKIEAKNHPEHAFMSLEKAKKIGKTLVENYGLNSIDIQGGEPTIYPQIFELIEYFNEIGLKPTLITNAIILDKKETCEKFKKAGVYDFLISVHALGDVYDEIVQVPGGSTRQQKAIQNLQELNIPFRFNTVLTKEVLPQLDEIARLAVQRGARALNFIMFNPFVDQSVDREQVLIAKYSQIAKSLTPVMDYLEENKREVNVRYAPFCVFEKRHRKNVQNFQQMTYDLHEWESGGEMWSGAESQRVSTQELSEPPCLYGRVQDLRLNYFIDEIKAVKKDFSPLNQFIADLTNRVKNLNEKDKVTIAMTGSAKFSKLTESAILNDEFLSKKCEIVSNISSKEYITSDTLNGLPWNTFEWLAENPADLILITTVPLFNKIKDILEKYNLADRIQKVESSKENDSFEKIFYMDELGEIEEFSEKEYAYKEYKSQMTKYIFPYSKKEACKKCSLCGICDGFHKDYANWFGFDEARPEELNGKVLDPRYYMCEQMKVIEKQEYNWALPDSFINK